MSSIPNYGKRLLPIELDKIAQRNPTKLFASIPISYNVIDGFRDVSFLEIANGVNDFAHFLERLYGRSDKFETLTYLGPADLRYVIVVLGAIKCGYKVKLKVFMTHILTHLRVFYRPRAIQLLSTSHSWTRLSRRRYFILWRWHLSFLAFKQGSQI